MKSLKVTQLLLPAASLLSCAQLGHGILNPSYDEYVGSGIDKLTEHSLWARQASAPACPGSNETSLTDNYGDTYLIGCDINAGGNAYITYQPTTGLSDCANQCSAYNQQNNGGCAAAAISGGNCLLRTGNATDHNPGIQSLVLQQTAPTCPASDQKTFTDVAGDTYLIRCDLNVGGDAYITYAATTGLADCANQCSNYNQQNNNACQAAVISGGNCLFRTSSSPNPHSRGCRA